MTSDLSYKNMVCHGKVRQRQTSSMLITPFFNVAHHLSAQASDFCRHPFFNVAHHPSAQAFDLCRQPFFNVAHHPSAQASDLCRHPDHTGWAEMHQISLSLTSPAVQQTTLTSSSLRQHTQTYIQEVRISSSATWLRPSTCCSDMKASMRGLCPLSCIIFILYKHV